MAVILKRPQQPKQPAKKKVMIAFPCYTGTNDTLTTRSLLNEIVDLASHGIECGFIDEVGNGLISHSRSKFIARFLESDFTHLMFIDDDVCWLKGSIRGLLSHDEDFVCGLYPRRTDPLTFNFRSQEEEGKDLTVNDKDLIEGIWGVPFGFACLSRACCEKMVDAYQNLEFQAERGRTPDGKDVPGIKAWHVFGDYFVPGPPGEPPVLLGEDYAFCQRWRDIGGKVYVDPHVQMGHTGRKTFYGKLGEIFQAAPGEAAAPDDQFEKDMDDLNKKEAAA